MDFFVVDKSSDVCDEQMVHQSFAVWPDTGLLGIVMGLLLICSGATAIAQSGPITALQTERKGGHVEDTRQSSKTGKSGLNLVSFSSRDSTVISVIRALAKQVNAQVVYDLDVPALQQTRAVRIVDQDIMVAVGTLLHGTGLTATRTSDGKTIVIHASKDLPGASQNQAYGIVTGLVTDSATGEPIGGVTVEISGESMRVITDAKGRFVFNKAPAGSHSIVFKLLGYRSISRKVDVKTGQTVTVNTVLVGSANTLSGVVTTVTGEQRKLEIGNAITTINVDSVMQVAPVSSLTDLLEHRVPGLTVVRGSGQPGDPSRLRLRGASSINSSNEMIVVVDGVRVDADPKAFAAASFGNSTSGMTGYLGSSPFDLIDPNTIETIDVFKGPSAAAMYGSDAANGVLVITTKSGRAGPTKLSAALTRGLSYMPGKYPEGTYAYGWKERPSYGGTHYTRCIPIDITDPCIVDRIERYQALNDPYYTILGRGNTESYTMTASGGASVAQYSLTGSTSSEIGLLKMSDYLIDRYQTIRSDEMPSWMRRPDNYNTSSGTAQISSQVKPDLLVRITTGASMSKQRKTSLGNSAIATFSRMSRDASVSDNQDRFYERMYRKINSTTNALQVNWSFRENIRAMATAGYNTSSSVDETMLPAGFEGRIALNGFGTYSIGRQSRQTRTVNANAEVPVFSNRIKIILGGTYNGNDGESFQISNRKVPEGMTRPNFFEEGGSINSTSESTRGWYLEPRLNLRSRFFVMPGFRLDNNGLSGRNAGAFLLPKLSTSYIISDEDFFPWKDYVSQLRIRIAGGVAGTQPGITDRLRMLRVSQIEGQTQEAVEFVSLGNTRLRPERSREFEGGIDLDVWNGRAGIVYTLYDKVRYDAIQNVSLAGSVTLGSQSFTQNIGTIKNSGHELEFRITPLEQLNVAWTTNGSVNVNSNRVVKLRTGLLPLVLSGSGAIADRSATSRVVEGYPLWGLWARPLIGYQDVNQDGVITSDEITLADSMVYLGQPDPKGKLTWSNDVRLLSGRLSISALTSYDWGMMQVASWLQNPNSPFNTVLYAQSPSLEEQALIQAAKQTSHPISQTVNTFRLQSLSLNLVLPPHIAHRLRGRSVSLALQGSNLWMKSNYIGKDPNVGSLNLMDGLTEDRGLIPQPRKWQLRVRWGN